MRHARLAERITGDCRDRGDRCAAGNLAEHAQGGNCRDDYGNADDPQHDGALAQASEICSTASGRRQKAMPNNTTVPATMAISRSTIGQIASIGDGKGQAAAKRA